MQFRERRRVIQVIRTTYDPELKRGRAEVLGRIDKATSALTDKLVKNCTPEELAEVHRYLSERSTSLHDEAVRAGAETLPQQMRRAAEYFRVHSDDEARRFAAEIRAAWNDLKSAIRKAGFAKENGAAAPKRSATDGPRLRIKRAAEPPDSDGAPKSRTVGRARDRKRPTPPPAPPSAD